MKTESKNDSFELQRIVGKKLATENNSPKHNPGINQFLNSDRNRNKDSQRKFDKKPKV